MYANEADCLKCMHACLYKIVLQFLCAVGTGGSMEDSIEVMLQEQNLKLLHRYRDSRVPTFAAGAVFSGLYGLWAMFCLPGLKVPFRLKVPFLPSTKVQTENVMKLLEGRRGRLADLGSGDGRLVSQSSRLGYI